jgi:FMN phosphatase YigB (HAD superfamily)
LTTKKGILFDWVGVLVVPDGIPASDHPAAIAAAFRRYDPLWRLLPELSLRFRMCIVNNGPRATIPFFEQRFGYSRYMDFVNSEEVGLTKPDPRIYQLACRRIGVSPNEVFYLDDCDDLPPQTVALDMDFIHWPTPDDGFREFCRRVGVPVRM